MRTSLFRTLFFGLCCLSVTARGSASTTRIAEAPAGETLFEDCRLTVNGNNVPVYSCRVSAVPLNQVWPGYQRPVDQTEPAGFAAWDMDGPVNIDIECRQIPKSVVCRPSSLGITPKLDGQHISFALDQPHTVIVEVDGTHNALHLFPSPPETDIPAPDAPGVRCFGPGIHHPGPIELKSEQTIYIAAGAVVYGSIHAANASNIRIAGRGILDVAPFKRGEGGGAIRLTNCSNVRIEGIVMRDPDVWCCSIFACREVAISNVKLIGLWRYNADGIDVCNSENVIVDHCFVRAFDDALVIKGIKSFDDRPVRNVRFSRCVIWCDWGRAMEIGAETCAPEISAVLFQDSDIIRTTHIAMDIQHGDRATIQDILFDNIRVEIDDWNPPPMMQQTREEKYPEQPGDHHLPTLLEIVIRDNPYSQDQSRGSVRNITYKDISVTSRRIPPSSFRGFDPDHDVQNVTIQNLRFNGQPIGTPQDAMLHLGPHVGTIAFSSTAIPSPPEPETGTNNRTPALGIAK